MTSSPNRFFNNYTFGPTQKLIEDLIVEAIRIHGVWVYYIPRTKQNLDHVFGEDKLSKFEDAIKIEAYIKNVEGFEGQGRLLSKFGVEVRDEVTFTIARRRFEESRAEHLLTEDGQIFEQEVTNRYYAFQINGFLLERGDIEGYFLDFNRPREGDLIYLPQTDKLFEIKYTQHDAIFYQGGELQTYDLYCEMFEYSHEEINTGYTEIDDIEDLLSGNITDDYYTAENGDIMLLEDGGRLIVEAFYPETTDKQANNNLFRTESEDVIDWSEVSPFVRRDVNLRW